MFVRARSLTQAAVREINSVCLQSNQCVGMATQLGGNARQKAASERKECIALVLCLCEREQESNLTSERGEAVRGVPDSVVREVLLRSSLSVWRGSVVMYDSTQATSLMIPGALSGGQKLKSIDLLFRIIIITNS